MPLLDAVAAYLDTNSTVFTLWSGTGGNLGKAVMMDHAHAPSTFASLYETPGIPNVYTFSTSATHARVAMEAPSFQLLSRSTNYATARSRAQTAYTMLDGLAGQTLSGTLYQEITAAQAPFFLQRDESDRYLVATNYFVLKQVG